MRELKQLIESNVDSVIREQPSTIKTFTLEQDNIQILIDPLSK